MKRILCLCAVLALVASASASVEFFFTSSLDAYGLNDPSLAFLHSKGNGTDFIDGYKLSPAGAPPLGPQADVELDCTPGAPPQWAYVWARFNAEPTNVIINGIAVGVAGALAGQGNIAWYACDNTLDPDIELKRWDGDPDVFYFNPAGLVAVTAYGVRNRTGDQGWNLYVGGNYRTFLLGAVKCATCPSQLRLTFGPIPVNYTTSPPYPDVSALNKVICVPEPASLMLLALAGLVLRRR